MRTFTTYTLEDIKWYKGWSNIIIDSFNKIQEHITDNNTLDIYYIKDKRGHIDFSWSGGDEYIHDILRTLEVETSNICCECGDKGLLRENVARIMPYCDKCFILFFDEMGRRKVQKNEVIECTAPNGIKKGLDKLDSELKIIDEKVKELLGDDNNVSESTTTCRYIVWIVIAIIVLLYFIF
ncbi:MAG TPA: hypothetical protein PLW93_00240 [Candidatus Absconditabacterales bacterium]|nr:hypothetical protein [Candidatus Absconditabacterales bacterium]